MSMRGRHVGPFEILGLAPVPGTGDTYLGARTDGGTPAQVWARVAGAPPAPGRAALKRQHDILLDIDDPRIPRSLSWHEDIGAMLMEHVDGWPLTGAILARRDESVLMTPATLLDLMLEVADALAAAHALGYVHGHLDPDHVWLDIDGQVWLLGMGEPTSPPPSRWLPPELPRGQSLSPNTDQWGLAALGVALVTGLPPWSGPDPVGAAHHGDPDRSVSPVAQQWPALARVLRRMLDESPTHRFADLQSVRLQLLRLARQAGGRSDRRSLGAFLAQRGPVRTVAADTLVAAEEIDREASFVLAGWPPSQTETRIEARTPAAPAVEEATVLESALDALEEATVLESALDALDALEEATVLESALGALEEATVLESALGALEEATVLHPQDDAPTRPSGRGGRTDEDPSAVTRIRADPLGPTEVFDDDAWSADLGLDEHSQVWRVEDLEAAAASTPDPVRADPTMVWQSWLIALSTVTVLLLGGLVLVWVVAGYMVEFPGPTGPPLQDPP